MKTPLTYCTRTSSFIESGKLILEVAPEYRADLTRDDGDQNACRVQFNAITNKPIYNSYDSYCRVVYPWLLIDIFSVPAKK